MKADRSHSPLSPVLAAATRRRLWRRQGGGGAKIVANNFVAEKLLRRGPDWGNRKNAGAPPGNANAQTHGQRTAKAKALHKRLRDLERRADAQFAEIDRALAQGVDPYPHIAKLSAIIRRAAGASP